MSTETALLRAICADPDEDTPRLAFADYLDETGDPDRAAFIRAQVELATLKDDSMPRRELAFRARQLLDASEEAWLQPRESFERDWAWSRGFVETFSTTPADLDHGHAELFRTHPLRRVWLWELGGSADGVWLLPTDNRIRALDLIGNNLNIHQLRKLAKVPHLTHVRELGLMFNDLRDTSVKVLCGEPFFQNLELIRLGANPFTPRGRDQLRAHFGNRVTFAHEREPERLYTIQDDYLRAGCGKDYTQLLMLAGVEMLRVARFDHAGNLLRTDHRHVRQVPGANYQRREMSREAERDEWLAELGYRSVAIKVKAFRIPNGAALTPFNWWAGAFDARYQGRHENLNPASIQRWLEEGQYRFYFGDGNDTWFDRTGEVTDT